MRDSGETVDVSTKGEHSIHRRFLRYLGKYILWIVTWLLCKSLRVRVVNSRVLSSLESRGGKYVLAFWHGSMLYIWYRHRKHGLAALVSKSEDGEILAKTLQHWGYKVIRGSSSAGGHEAMDLMGDALRAGHALAITPDGPRGPCHVMKMGAVRLAQKAGVPLILCASKFRKRIVLRSWDRFEIPMPFSDGVLIYGEPVMIQPSLSGEALDAELRRIEKILCALDAEAQQLVDNAFVRWKSFPAVGGASRWLLAPVALLYGTGVAIRNMLYDIGLLKEIQLPVPVISIGNLTAGGTGKTPLVKYMAKYLREKGWGVAVLTRGYGRRSRGTIVVSKPGAQDDPLPRAVEAGDEPVELASVLQGLTVIVDHDRRRSGRYALSNYGANVLLLDDGFQYRALHRDLNVLLVDNTRPAHREPLLPMGLRRESLRSLRRADIVVLTKASDEILSQQNEAELKKFIKAPLFRTVHTPAAVWLPLRNMSETSNWLLNKRVVPLCGIGDPESFRLMVRTLGAEIVQMFVYPDHTFFSEKDIFDALSVARAKSADALVTTRKDWVRIESLDRVVWSAFPDIDLAVLDIEIRFLGSEEHFWALVESALGGLEKRRS
ncbi:MAG: tetraacyldisaccharide 4'-kinase [Bacteroidota bacterium]